ncbi:MAG: hypothetical protein N3B14_00275 [Thermoleophilia bacterium]|nr:hypothetical protein [Thermoleophilia bacterium]
MVGRPGGEKHIELYHGLGTPMMKKTSRCRLWLLGPSGGGVSLVCGFLVEEAQPDVTYDAYAYLPARDVVVALEAVSMQNLAAELSDKGGVCASKYCFC